MTAVVATGTRSWCQARGSFWKRRTCRDRGSTGMGVGGHRSTEKVRIVQALADQVETGCSEGCTEGPGSRGDSLMIPRPGDNNNRNCCSWRG